MALQEAAFERVVVVVPESGGGVGGGGSGGGGSSLSSSAAAAKSSQPLHNFSLPFLKWGNQTNKNKNHSNSNSNSRCRKLVESSSREFSPSRDHHRSSASEPDSAAADDDDDEEEGAAAAHRHRRARATANGNTNNGDGSSSGSKNRFSFANCAAAAAVEGSGNVGASRKGSGLEEGEEMVELVQKPWNLRPRRSACKSGGELGEKTENLPKSGRLRSLAEGHQIVENEKKKRRLVIALSRDEVDEDFFIMTGSKASRRPKKRAKNIQKLVDSGLPGLWLVGLTADSYTIPDVPAKK
ncbi:hypothetical protein Sjap_004488 [Stephania japonica]|uniref:Uncharacterized protein n=1 Tax=Stephania japonica TaxID=461633 RepID=A0AAP0K4L6_9MAGN